MFEIIIKHKRIIYFAMVTKIIANLEKKTKEINL